MFYFWVYGMYLGHAEDIKYMYLLNDIACMINVSNERLFVSQCQDLLSNDGGLLEEQTN